MTKPAVYDIAPADYIAALVVTPVGDVSRGSHRFRRGDETAEFLRQVCYLDENVTFGNLLSLGELSGLNSRKISVHISVVADDDVSVAIGADGVELLRGTGSVDNPDNDLAEALRKRIGESQRALALRKHPCTPHSFTAQLLDALRFYAALDHQADVLEIKLDELSKVGSEPGEAPG